MTVREKNKDSEEIIHDLALKNPEVMIAKKTHIPKIHWTEFEDILCCPACHSDLERVENIMALRCVNEKCDRIYSINNDIPNMIVEDANANL